jgi:hypothetical protein
MAREEGTHVRLLTAGRVPLRFLPPAEFRYELWSFRFARGEIELEHRYIRGLSYGEALCIYRGYGHGNYALVRVFAEAREIMKFKFEGGHDCADNC